MIDGSLSSVQFETHPRVQRFHRPDRPRFSHFEGKDEELADLVGQQFGKASIGKYPDTYVVNIDGPTARRFYAPGERMLSDVFKPQASSVQVIVWSKKALELAGDRTAKKMTANFAVVSIKAAT